MVDFYTVEEPMRKPDHHDHMHGLELTMAQYYSTLLSKIMNHVSDSDVHVTAEEKESWNNKADKSTVDSIKETVDGTKDAVDNIDDTIQKYIKRYLNSDNFDTTILNNYATIKYVNDQINKINGYDIVDYAKKDWVNQNFVKAGTIPTFDSSKYYTKSEIDNKITSTGVSYAITDFAFRDGKLSIVQENGINTSINIGSGSDSGVSEDEITAALSSYLKKGSLGTLTFKRNGNQVLKWSPEEGSASIDISGTGGSGGTGEDGGTYVPYFKLYTSRTELPTSEWPTPGLDPAKNKWSKNVAPNAGSFQYVWMTQVLIKAGSFLEFTEPFCITGPNGDPGSDATGKEYIYKRMTDSTVPNKYTGTEKWGSSTFSDGWTDNPQGVTDLIPYEWIMYRTMDSDNNVSEWKPDTGPVLWSHYGHNGTDGDGVEYIFASLKPGETTELFAKKDEDPTKWTHDTEEEYGVKGGFLSSEYIRPTSKLWTDDPIDIAAEPGYGEGSKTYVSMRKRKGSKGTTEDSDAKWKAYSQPALWSYMAKNSEGGSQTLAGSPLRNKGKFVLGTMYRDGYTESENGVFWLDFVEHENNYYVCVTQNDNITPGTNEVYWQLMSYTLSMFTELLSAKKAWLGEITTNEVVCVNDSSNVVAGITSGKSNNVASGAGNVRIWAGSTNTGNIQSAPFTVTDEGVLTCTGSEGTIKIANGTIYFIKGGWTNKLTIDETTGEPKWDRGGLTVKEQLSCYQITSSGNYAKESSMYTLYNINDKWYNKSVNGTLVTGTYYEKVSSRAITYQPNFYYVATNLPINAIYKKYTFTSGVRQFVGLVGTTRTMTKNNLGDSVTDYFWAEIKSTSQVTSGFYKVYVGTSSTSINSYSGSISYDTSDNLVYLQKASSETVYTGSNYSEYNPRVAVGEDTINIVSNNV